MKPSDHIEWNSKDPEAQLPFFTKRQAWGWLSAELVRIQPTTLEYRAGGQTAYLALHDIVRCDGETNLGGSCRSTIPDLRGKLTFTPIGCPAEGWAHFKSRVSTVFAVHLAPDDSLRSSIDISAVPPALYFTNRQIRTTLEKLQSVVDGSGIEDRAYADTLGLLLLWEIRQMSNPASPPQKPVRGGLTGQQLKLLKEYIRFNISNEIGISVLADLVGFSQFHFIRAFKISTGVSPYQYVLAQRIDFAKQVLLTGNTSLDVVARTAGFRNVTQLNRTFQKVTSITPTMFRREQGVGTLHEK